MLTGAGPSSAGEIRLNRIKIFLLIEQNRGQRQASVRVEAFARRYPRRCRKAHRASLLCGFISPRVGFRPSCVDLFLQGFRQGDGPRSVETIALVVVPTLARRADVRGDHVAVAGQGGPPPAIVAEVFAALAGRFMPPGRPHWALVRSMWMSSSAACGRSSRLCCSLIHDPDLLILDEPKTGVDPLSRRGDAPP